MPDFLERRVAELEGRARERDLDVEEMSTHLPEDPRARAAALATVLGLDALQALRDGVTYEQLEQEAEARRLAAEQAAGESAKAGIPPPPAVGEGAETSE
jgi:hypothetical protein